MAKISRNIRFEEAMHKLESLVEQIESGQVGVEEAVSMCEEAIALQAHCQRILDQAEQRIKRIQLDAAGGLTASAHDEAQACEEDDAADEESESDEGDRV